MHNFISDNYSKGDMLLSDKFKKNPYVKYKIYAPNKNFFALIFSKLTGELKNTYHTYHQYFIYYTYYILLPKIDNNI